MRTAALLLLVVLVTAACGRAGHRTASARCVVTLYFKPTTPRARALQVAERLRRYERIARVDFVSKQKALRIMLKKYPYLMKSLARNPLPDALIVWPRSVGERDDVLRALHPPPPGVDKIRSSRSCA